MYGGELNCPITIRLIIGRGWGQGPTHSQNLQSWFAHIPGLKVVMPTFPSDAKELLEEAIQDPNPVIFLEHRWLHNTEDPPEMHFENRISIGESRICKNGSDFTVITSGLLTLEAMKAASHLKEKYKILIEVIDLISIKPIDYKTIQSSVMKTKNLLVVDSGYSSCSIASEIISYITERNFSDLNSAPLKLAMPDCPEPTSFGLTNGFHIRASNIAKKILDALKIDSTRIYEEIPDPELHDVPGNWFVGPF